MLESWLPVLVGVTCLGLLGVALLVTRLRRRVDRGVAIVIHRAGRTRVSFDDVLVWPVLERAETVDLALRTVELDHRGKDGLRCRDAIRVDLTLVFHLRVNRCAEDVLRVADTVGCARASDPQMLRELFAARFTEASKVVARRRDFDDLHDDRLRFKDELLATIGRDLNGYVLDDLAITHLEQTPLAALDPNDILDAVGIRRIAERTAAAPDP